MRRASGAGSSYCPRQIEKFLASVRTGAWIAPWCRVRTSLWWRAVRIESIEDRKRNRPLPLGDVP
jgi:hypothetical protein